MLCLAPTPATANNLALACGSEARAMRTTFLLPLVQSQPRRSILELNPTPQQHATSLQPVVRGF